MKLYNQILDKVKDYRHIEGDFGIAYPDKIEEALLNNYGFYKISYESQPSRRYYTYTENRELVGNVYTTSYVSVDRDLQEVKDKLLIDLKSHKQSIQDGRPVVDTTLGFNVDGGYRDLQNLQGAKDMGLAFCIDVDGVTHDILVTDWDTIIGAVQLNGLYVIQTNGIKKAEIATLTDVASCVLYEATPYEYTITEEDIDPLDEINTYVVGDIITKYKNNVKEW